jgi:hypothetical protein
VNTTYWNCSSCFFLICTFSFTWLNSREKKEMFKYCYVLGISLCSLLILLTTQQFRAYAFFFFLGTKRKKKNSQDSIPSLSHSKVYVLFTLLDCLSKFLNFTRNEQTAKFSTPVIHNTSTY